MKKVKTTKLELPAPATKPVGESTRVPYALIRPDPNQPRKTFDEAKLKELAESIAQQGILQPLILERMPKSVVLREPELTRPEWLLENLNVPEDSKPFDNESAARLFLARLPMEVREDHYRIVCGERRWRALGMLSETPETPHWVPAVVYSGLTEAQRFAFQFIENNQREAITALEEAAALSATLADRRAADPKYSPDTLAAELGMSRAALYERLKLTRLQPALRTALLAGQLNVSCAAEIAKLPTPKMQEKILETLLKHAKFGHNYSVRELADLVADEMKQLADAPFKTDTEYFDAKGALIGNGSCPACPQRTGNMLADFPELKARPNVCTNPDCFAAKCKAFHLATAAAAKDKGATVLTDQEFKAQRAELVAGDSYQYGTNKSGEFEKLVGKHKPEPVLRVTETGIERFYRRDEAAQALAKAGVKFAHKSDGLETKVETAKREAEELANKLRGERREALVLAAWPRLGKALEKLNQAKSWEAAALLIKDGNGYLQKEAEAHLVKGVKDARLVVLGRLFADEEKSPLNYSNEWDMQVVDAWKVAGVDLVADFAASEAALDTHPLGLALAKLKPTQMEMIKVAQAKRWAKIKKK